MAHFFGSASEPAPAEIPTAAPTEAAAPSQAPTPPNGQPHARKKSPNEVHIAVEKASQASESAAQASEKALQASKQARQAANAASEAEGQGAGARSGKSVVSLEENPVPSAATPDLAGATPAPRAKGTPGLESASVATASLPTAGSSGEPDPANAAKLINDVDKIEKRIDRNNLSADETQRDVLAQRLLQDAKKALADHDNVAATGLATKASTLLAPLPKVASSATR